MQVSPFRRMAQCWGQDHISILDCGWFGSTPASEVDDALSEFEESTLENGTYWGVIPWGRTQFYLVPIPILHIEQSFRNVNYYLLSPKKFKSHQSELLKPGNLF